MDVRPQTNNVLGYIQLSMNTIALIGFSIIGLYWLGLLIASFSIGFNLVFRIKAVRSNLYLYAFVSLISVFLLVLMIRAFVFEVYNIPSASMTPTLLIGDKVLVNKLVYGPKLPRYLSEVPWINLFFPPTGQSKEDDWGYHRLTGYKYAQRNEIMVFIFGDKKIIKRCVAGPGDIFELRNGEVYVDGKQADGEAVQQTYRIWQKPKEVDGEAEGKAVSRDSSKRNYLERVVPRWEREELVRNDEVDSVIFSAKGPLFASAKDPWYKSGDWTLGNIGPVLVPDIGDKILLNAHNYAIYHKLIQDAEGVRILNKGKSFFVGGKMVKSYAFKKRYYFFMGDNRDLSIDSRFFGLVSEDHIEGKATFLTGSATSPASPHGRLLKWVR